MKKFPRVKYPGDSETDGILAGDVVVTEKLDGANFRFTANENGKLVFGSRNVVFTEGDEPLPIEEINKAFRHAAEYIQTELTDEGIELLKEYTLYGEAMHLHSLQYDDIKYEQPPYGGSPYATNIPNVLFFDARHNGDWVDWRNFEQLLSDVGLVSAPVLEKGTPSELDLDIPDSSAYGENAEGIVVRRIDGSVRAKKVSEDFKEKNATTFNDPSKAQTQAGEFVSTYITDARIEKAAHKLVDEGGYESIGMQMMKDLPRNVLVDAMSENAWELLTDGPEIELDEDTRGEIRSKTSSKCARVLKTMLNSF